MDRHTRPNKTYKIQDITERRKEPDGTVQYFTIWENYAEGTWEPKKYLKKDKWSKKRMAELDRLANQKKAEERKRREEDDEGMDEAARNVREQEGRDDGSIMAVKDDGMQASQGSSDCSRVLLNSVPSTSAVTPSTQPSIRTPKRATPTDGHTTHGSTTKRQRAHSPSLDLDDDEAMPLATGYEESEEASETTAGSGTEVGEPNQLFGSMLLPKEEGASKTNTAQSGALLSNLKEEKDRALLESLSMSRNQLRSSTGSVSPSLDESLRHSATESSAAPTETSLSDHLPFLAKRESPDSNRSLTASMNMKMEKTESVITAETKGDVVGRIAKSPEESLENIVAKQRTEETRENLTARVNKPLLKKEPVLRIIDATIAMDEQTTSKRVAIPDGLTSLVQRKCTTTATNAASVQQPAYAYGKTQMEWDDERKWQRNCAKFNVEVGDFSSMNVFSCTHCPHPPFAALRTLVFHIMLEHTSQGYRRPCLLCGFALEGSVKFHKHLDFHKEEFGITSNEPSKRVFQTNEEIEWHKYNSWLAARNVSYGKDIEDVPASLVYEREVLQEAGFLSNSYGLYENDFMGDDEFAAAVRYAEEDNQRTDFASIVANHATPISRSPSKPLRIWNKAVSPVQTRTTLDQETIHDEFDFPDDEETSPDEGMRAATIPTPSRDKVESGRGQRRAKLQAKTAIKTSFAKTGKPTIAKRVPTTPNSKVVNQRTSARLAAKGQIGTAKGGRKNGPKPVPKKPQTKRGKTSQASQASLPTKQFNDNIRKTLGIHRPGDKYCLGSKQKVDENVGDLWKEVQRMMRLPKSQMAEWEAKCGGWDEIEYIVNCTPYEGVWDESKKAMVVKIAVKYKGIPLPYIMEYSTMKHSKKRDFHIQWFRWQQEILSKARERLRKECEDKNLEFEKVFSQVFLPKTLKAYEYSKHPTVLRHTLIAARQHSINEIMRRANQPPVLLCPWIANKKHDHKILNFRWTNYVHLSSKIKNVLKKINKGTIQGVPIDSRCTVVKSKDGTTRCVHEDPNVECYGRDCQCSVEECSTRVIQRGRQHPLMILPHNVKGWTIRALEKIMKNEFVGTYAGQVLTWWENRLREKTYGIDLEWALVDLAKNKQTYKGHDGKKHSGYIYDYFNINADRLSNEGRIYPHDCDGNIRMEPRHLLRVDKAFHHWAYFADRDIEPGEEMGWSYYGDAIPEARKKGKLHHCILLPGCACERTTCGVKPWTKADFAKAAREEEDRLKRVAEYEKAKEEMEKQKKADIEAGKKKKKYKCDDDSCSDASGEENSWDGYDF